jgi:hypothetical protein
MLESNPAYEEHMTRRTALWFYGAYCVLGLVGDVIAIWKYGVTRPFHLATYSAVFLLSLAWIRSTMKSGPPTWRKFGVRASILLILGLTVPILIRWTIER